MADSSGVITNGDKHAVRPDLLAGICTVYGKLPNNEHRARYNTAYYPAARGVTANRINRSGDYATVTHKLKLLHDLGD